MLWSCIFLIWLQLWRMSLQTLQGACSRRSTSLLPINQEHRWLHSFPQRCWFSWQVFIFRWFGWLSVLQEEAKISLTSLRPSNKLGGGDTDQLLLLGIKQTRHLLLLPSAVTPPASRRQELRWRKKSRIFNRIGQRKVKVWKSLLQMDPVFINVSQI